MSDTSPRRMPAPTATPAVTALIASEIKTVGLVKTVTVTVVERFEAHTPLVTMA